MPLTHPRQFGPAIVAAILVAVVSTGCAIQMPMSESVMFAPRDNRFGVEGISAGYSTPRLPTVSEFGTRQRRLHEISAAATLRFSDKFGYSLSAGAANGADITFKLGERTYATAAGAIGGVEVGLQTKLVDRSSTGISLGPFYRAELTVLDELANNERFWFFPFNVTPIDSTYYDQSVGLRMNLFVFGTRSPVYGRAVGTVAYSIDDRRPIVRIGISLGVSMRGI